MLLEGTGVERQGVALLGNYKLLSYLLLATMCILYYIFR